MKKLVLIGLFLFTSTGLAAQIVDGRRINKYEHFLSVFATFQQEAPYLKEWIEYNKLMGVNHFYLYNNNSTDNYLQILQPYIDSNEVDLIERPSHRQANLSSYRTEALRDAIARSRDETRWLAIIDVDDFLLPLNWGSLTEMLDEHENYGQVIVMRRYFGTSHAEKIPEGKLLIETLLYREEFVPGKINPSKPIVKPQVVESADIHECRLKPHCQTKFYNDGLEEYPPVILNHYWTRDLDFLLTVKRERMEKRRKKIWTQEEIDHYSSIYNDVCDEIMLFFAPYVRVGLFGEKPEFLFSRSKS